MGSRKGVRPRSVTTRCFCSTHGDCLAATLRPGNVPSAEGWDDLLLPEIDRQPEGNRVAFRADCGVRPAGDLDALEQRDVDYAIRMPANKSLELKIEELLFRPPGRPGCKPLTLQEFPLSAKSCDGRCRQGGAPPG